MVSAVGELVKVIVFAALVFPITVAGNLRLAGAIVTGATAFPVRFTSCVPGAALSTKVIAPSTLPTAVGEKLTVTVHDVAGARLDPQVVLLGNSPLTAMLVMVRVLVVLVFFSVTVVEPLVVPSACAAKATAAGVTVTV